MLSITDSWIQNKKGCLRFVIVVFPDHTHLLFLRFHGNNMALLKRWSCDSRSIYGYGESFFIQCGDTDCWLNCMIWVSLGKYVGGSKASWNQDRLSVT